MTARRVARYALAYLSAGALMAVVFYLLTGGSSRFAMPEMRLLDGTFASAVFVPRITHVPGLLVVYAITRSPLALLEGLALAWMTGNRWKPWSMVSLGAVLPVVFEVATAPPYAEGWLGVIAQAVVPGSPWAAPAWPPHLQLGLAVAYLLPGTLAGTVVAAWVAWNSRPRSAEATL